MKIVSGSNMQSSAMASRYFLEFQQLLDRLSSEKKFNGAVVVCKNGQLPTTMRSSKVIYGDIKDDTPLRIGSVTKLFTSIVVMKLVQNGKLNLNDTLGEKIPNCPERLKAIAIKQLLTHTSGLSNDFDDQSDIGQQKIIDAIGKKRGGA